MSLNHITSSAVENPWMNINCNDLKCQTFTSAQGPTFNGPFAITETKASTISGPLPSFSSLLQIQNTDTTANSYQQGISIRNALGNNMKLIVQNTTGTSFIYNDVALGLLTQGNPGTISLSPNQALALTTSSSDGISANTQTVVSGNISVSNQPYLELQIPSAVSIPNTTLTTITGLTTVVRNVGGITYSAGTFTVPSTGVYTISYGGQYAASGTGTGVRRLNVTVAPSAYVYAGSSDSIGTNTDTSLLSSSVTLYLTPANTFVVQAQQTSGSALNLSTLDVVVYKCS